jgi:hypothetical protein
MFALRLWVFINMSHILAFQFLTAFRWYYLSHCVSSSCYLFPLLVLHCWNPPLVVLCLLCLCYLSECFPCLCYICSGRVMFAPVMFIFPNISLGCVTQSCNFLCKNNIMYIFV